MAQLVPWSVRAVAADSGCSIGGNHENYSLQWKPYRGDLYLNLFDLPLNGPEGLQKQAYSYDYGDVHFSVIDTQQEELNEWKPELIASQVSWLERDLAASDKKWKIVLVHRNLFRYQDGRPNELGSALFPVIDRGNVDVVFLLIIIPMAVLLRLKTVMWHHRNDLYFFGPQW